MNKNFSELTFKDRSYITLNQFIDLGVKNGFSRRLGGTSNGVITGFNFGFSVGDDEKNVLRNYKYLADDLGFKLDRAVCARQMHTDNIRIVTEMDCGKGVIVVDSDIQDTDGLITNLKRLPLIVFAADCVPILFLDKEKMVIGATHAGWRGTAKGIAGKTVRMMKENFGSNPKDIIVAIGPSIGNCCFEVDRDTAMNFDKKYRTTKPNDKYHVDLWSVNRDSIVDMGVLTDNIFISEECTICNSDKYYSYRTHKETTGRQVGVISLP